MRGDVRRDFRPYECNVRGRWHRLIKFVYAIMPILTYYKLRVGNNPDKKVRSDKGPHEKGPRAQG